MSYITLGSVYPVTSHTDFVGPGTTFVAISGNKVDGLSFVPLALQKGATTIVVQQEVELSNTLQEMIREYEAKIIYVLNCRKALAEMSAEALGHPAKKLKIIGVTGTKGKTSTSYMLYHMLSDLGKKVALSSTIEKLIEKDLVKISLTTPLPDQLHMFLDLCVKRDIEYVVLEVSAQALSLHRVDGIEFEAGVFTNFSLEHLEFFKDLQEYFLAKASLVDYIKKHERMFINIDDKYGVELKNMYPDCSTFSLENKSANVYGYPHFNRDSMGIHVKIDKQTFFFQAPLLGRFNAYNMIAAVSVLRVLGIDLQKMKTSMMSLQRIPGRMEQYALQNGSRCFIDYAHNPSSFEAVLSTLRMMTSDLIVVFGAGGCRDKHKRPLMGAVAQRYGNTIILTSDNPRDEDPEDIVCDIQRGFTQTDSCQIYKELNRTKAIEKAYSISGKQSIIAILGKGPDEYQIVGDLTFPFKERSIIKKFMQEDL